VPGQILTQQIYLFNDVVGAISDEVEDIRDLSGSVLEIGEQQANSNQRASFTGAFTGTEQCNLLALT
jgi:hypothetical protein